MVHRLLVVGALAVGALGLGACADAGTSRATTPETRPASPDIAVTGTNQLTFEPDAFEIPVGEEITLELTAQGVEHDVVVADAAEVGTVGEDDPDDAAASDLRVAHADVGQTTTATFTIDEPGSYEIYCSVPGHRQAGMTATMTVTDAG